MSPQARLVLLRDPSKVAPLDPARPHTIGRAANNLLSMPTTDGVAPHHAVVRFSRSHGWLVCDWGSPEGTWLEGQRVRHCRPLADGDQIRLGQRGPVLVFQLQPAAAPAALPLAGGAGPAASPSVGSGAGAAPAASGPVAASASGVPVSAGPVKGRASAAASRPPAAPLRFAGREIPLEQVRSAHVHSRARYPNSFSWWALISLGGLVLLPWPFLFWPLEIAALVAWILLGSRKEHVLIVTLRDGMAHRHSFANKITALSHRNGIRGAIGQSLERAPSP